MTDPDGQVQEPRGPVAARILMPIQTATWLPSPAGTPPLRLAHSDPPATIATTAAPLRAPNRARSIADRLRTQILGGELANGSTLPPLDNLMATMQASKASVRQALHILESEGIVQVRRGRLGGSVVHSPDVVAGSAVESAIQVGNVAAEDLSEALVEFEPICAGLCARRPDRASTVLPHLQRVHDHTVAGLFEDTSQWSRQARMFHEELVGRCGNATIVLAMGAVESACTSRAAEWTTTQARALEPQIRLRNRKRALADHALIMELIEAGDSDGAVDAARRHLQWVPAYTSAERPTVRSS